MSSRFVKARAASRCQGFRPGAGRGEEGTVRGWWERAMLSVAERRVSECDESIDRYARV